MLSAGAAVVLAGAVLAGCAACGRTTQLDPADVAAGIERATNAARADEQLDPLAHSDCAAAVAAERARALVGNPDLEHAPLEDVMQRCDVTTAGENLSRSSLPPQAVVDAWLASPGHRANILDAAYTQIGVACVADGDAALCAQVFLGP